MTDVNINSTWLDMVLDMDANFKAPGSFVLKNRIDAMGKVSAENWSEGGEGATR